MARAVMEGVVFQNALILREFEKAGQALTDIRLTGGGAQSDLWSQIQADVYGKAVSKLAEDEAGLLGAAILAGVGAGLFETIDAGVDSMVKTTNRFEPDGQRHNVYVDVVRRFEDLYARIYS